MKIDKNNYENFYGGISCEHFIISQIFMYGYEAYKPDIDIGYDILVTNKALQMYKGVDDKNIYIQVKSIVHTGNKSRITLDKQEFDRIKSDENAVLILCIRRPSIREAKTFDYNYNHFMEVQIMDSVQEYTDGMLLENYKYLDSDQRSNLDIKDYKYEYIWLNNKHLNLLAQKKFEYYGEKVYIYIYSDDESIGIVTKKEYENETELNLENMLVLEVKNIYYLLHKSGSTEALDQGKIFYADY